MSHLLRLTISCASTTGSGLRTRRFMKAIPAITSNSRWPIRSRQRRPCRASMNESSVFYEGWALYCEQLMHEQGFLKTRQHRFVMLKDRLWRALRIIIDVKTQTGKMTYDEAADLMVRELHFPRQHRPAAISTGTASRRRFRWAMHWVGRSSIVYARKKSPAWAPSSIYATFTIACLPPVAFPCPWSNEDTL